MSEQIDEASGTLLPSPEADVAAADAAVTGIWREPFDSLLGPPLEGEALEDELRRQLEYFLSPEYLATDPDLVSQMNSDMSFPITTVATLTTFKVDMDVLLKSISKSSSLTISDDGTKVTPNFKIQRNTIILRDIPSSTKVEEVQSIFQGANCPVVTGIRPDIEDCWFVTFNSEEDALTALDFVRERSFRDAPIKARIKSENLLRIFSYYAPAADLDPIGLKVPPQGYSLSYPQYAYHPQAEFHQDHRRQRGHRQLGPTGSRKDYRHKYNNGHNSAAQGNPTVAAMSSTASTTHTRGSHFAPEGENRKQRRPGNRGNRKQQEGHPNNVNTKSSQNQPPLQLGLAHFPPLSSQPQTKPRQTGYTKDFAKFTKQQLIDIIGSTPTPSQQPSSFPTECLATLSEPNTQILISSESNLDRLIPAQDGKASTHPAREVEETANPTFTVPTQNTTPTMTMASLVATHSKKLQSQPPQPQTKPKSAPHSKEVSTHSKSRQNNKRASSPKHTSQQKPEEGVAQQHQAATTNVTSAEHNAANHLTDVPATVAFPGTPAATPTPTPAPTPAATPAPTPAATPAPTPAATPATTPAATPATTPAATPATTPAATPATTPAAAHASSIPTYAQQAAKAASKPATVAKKEADREGKKEKREGKKEKREEKESTSA